MEAQTPFAHGQAATVGCGVVVGKEAPANHASLVRRRGAKGCPELLSVRLVGGWSRLAVKFRLTGACGG